MKEVITMLGVTPDPGTGFPEAVKEWCINTAAIDPFTTSVIANSEDGKVYRWNLTTNTLSEVVTLSTGKAEAYTPTVIGADGTERGFSTIDFGEGRTGTPGPANRRTTVSLV